MAIKSYRELLVWQAGMRLAKASYEITERLPRREVYGLTAQIRRCAVSLPSNIAEGQGRRSTKEFLRFISIAQGSLSELETQILLTVELGYLGAEEIIGLSEQTDELGRMLNGLRLSLERKIAA